MPQRRVLRVWRLANGRLERPNNRGLCAGKGQAATLEQQRLTARGLGGSGARDLEGFKSFKCLKPGKGMPQRRVLRVWRLANGRLERPKNRGLCAGKGQAATLEQQRLTARGLGGSWREGIWRVFRVLSVWSLANEMPQRRVLRVWRLASGTLERPNNRGLCAGKGQAATLGTAKADGQRAWWKLARGIWRVLRVLSVWSLANEMPQRRVLRVWRLANGRLERPNNRGLCAGEGQAATLEQQRLTARGLGGSWREGSGGVLRVLSVWSLAKEMPQRRVLRVWRLANGRLERPNNRGLCAGKGQAATLEQQRLTARGLGGSWREGSGGFSEF